MFLTINRMLLLMAVVVLSACQSTGGTKKDVSSQSGFLSHTLDYKGDGTKHITFVVMHGKSSSPEASQIQSLSEGLNAAGYDVVSLQMPWSKWNGTYDDGVQLINDTIAKLAKSGQKTVLVGHSMGGMMSLLYASMNDNPNLLAVVPVAPGHMLFKSNRMQNVTADSVEKANQLISEGKGNTYADFKELNNGKVRTVSAYPSSYASFYDMKKFPDIEASIFKLKKPVLWIAGKDDRLTSVYGMEDFFNTYLSDSNSKNKYVELAGGHVAVAEHSAKTIVTWVQQL